MVALVWQLCSITSWGKRGIIKHVWGYPCMMSKDMGICVKRWVDVGSSRRGNFVECGFKKISFIIEEVIVAILNFWSVHCLIIQSGFSILFIYWLLFNNNKKKLISIKIDGKEQISFLRVIKSEVHKCGNYLHVSTLWTRKFKNFYCLHNLSSRIWKLTFWNCYQVYLSLKI